MNDNRRIPTEHSNASALRVLGFIVGARLHSADRRGVTTTAATDRIVACTTGTVRLTAAVEILRLNGDSFQEFDSYDTEVTGIAHTSPAVLSQL